MINDIHTSITFPVIEIDAWAGDEEGLWDWNSWAYVGYLELNLDSPHQEIINLFITRGLLRHDCADQVEVEDDQFNLVIVDKETREPLFAIEYGSKI
jgi:hypothetical protein